MATLFNIITYNRQKYVDVTDPAGRQFIVELEQKLTILASDILKYPEGQIDIKTSGDLSIDGFPDQLRQNIMDLLKN